MKPAVSHAAAAGRVRLVPILVGAVLLTTLAVVALMRGGLLGLPAVPGGISAEDAGLADLAGLRARAALLEAEAVTGEDGALRLARGGLKLVREGRPAAGLDSLRTAVRLAPRDIVIGNAYRMAVFHLKREVLADTSARLTLARAFPPMLEREPFELFERIREEEPSREATLQFALAWVDELLLFQALEIAAPASVSSVDLFSEILAAQPGYVPALYGRGLNYLHRPARLVWPESRKAAPDAASRDIGLATAIGRRIGGASPRLVGTLALTLGDAYAKEGKFDRARSWWQIARNADRDRATGEGVKLRLEWQNAELRDRLEDELQRRMRDVEHPMTDLAVIWR